MRATRFTITALAAMLLAAPAMYAVDIPSIPGSDTKLSVYGFIRPDVSYYFGGVQTSSYVGALFENIPANSGSGNSPLDTHNVPNNNFYGQMKASQLGFATVTPTSTLGDVKTTFEFDLNNPSGNSSLGLRHAAVQFGGWTIGQYWSLWTDLGCFADTVDWSGPYGEPYYNWSRIFTVQYAFKLDKNDTLAIGLDNTQGSFGGGSAEISGAGATPLSSNGYFNNVTNKIPTMVAAFGHNDTWGHIMITGLAQNYSAFIAATPTTGSTSYNKIEAAGKISGDVKFGKDDLTFSGYYGNALGGYGLSMESALLVDSTQSVLAYKNLAWFVDYTHNWTDKVRSNIIISGATFSNNTQISALVPANTGMNGVNMGVKSGYNGYLNTFVKLAKNVELGLEYEYEQASPVGNNASQPGSPTVNSNDQAISKNSCSKLQADLHIQF